MRNLRFLKNQLKANNINFDEIKYIENKIPTYWVDLEVTFKDYEGSVIFRLPAYNKQQYQITNYNKKIMDEVLKLKELYNEMEKIRKKAGV